MATAQTIINRALRLIGALASGETPTSDESSDALTALNAMLASWQAEKLVVYAFVDTAFTMTPSDASYTVGPSANFNLTPRPPKIEQCFVRASNIDYPVELIDRERWYNIADKTSTSDIPQYAYYEPSLTTGTLQLYPVPSAANSLHIVTWSSVAELATVGTTVTLPQGYERALAYNLAVELAPEYTADPSATVLGIARESKAAIRRANIRPTLAVPDLVGMIGRKSDIYAGA